MSESLGSAVLDLTADSSKLKSDVDAAHGWVQGKMGGAAKLIAGAVATGLVAAGTAVAGFVAKGVSDFIGFQGQMNEVFTLMPGISEQAMGQMTTQVKDFAKEFGVLPQETVPALYQALSAGVPADNVFSFLETAQKAAVGGVTDLETAVDGISSVVNAYGSDVLSAGQASDLMFTTVRMGKTTFAELSESLFNVIPTASALGVQFGDVTAALASMTAQGVPTSVATTQLRQLFVELSKEGGTAAKTFEKLAGKSFAEFIASGGNVQQALQLMEKGAADSGKSISDMFGSVEAGNAALTLTGKGTETFSKNLDAMAGAAGATDAAYATMDKGIGRSIDKIKAGFATLLLDVGQKVAPAVASAADWIAGKMPAISDAIGTVIDTVSEKVSAFIAGFQSGGLAGGLAAIFPPSVAEPLITAINVVKTALDGIITAVQAIVSNSNILLPVLAGLAAGFAAFQLISFISGLVATVGAMGGVTAAAGGLGVALTTALGPIGLIAIAIAALVAVGVLLWKNWDTVKAVAETVWTAIKDFMATIWAAIKSGAETAWNAIKAFLETIWNAIKGAGEAAWNGIKTALEAVWNAMKASGEAIFNAYKAALTTIFEGAKTAVLAVANALHSGADTIWNGMVSTARVILDPIKTVIETPFKVAKELVSAAIGLIKALVQGDFEKFGGIISTALSNIVGIIEKPFKDAWEKVTGWVSKIREKIGGLNPFSHFSPAPADLIMAGWHNLNRELGGVMGDTYGLTHANVTAFRDEISPGGGGQASRGPTIGQLIINANDEAGGRAAADGFVRQCAALGIVL